MAQCTGAACEFPKNMGELRLLAMPPAETLASATLRDQNGADVKARSLWETQPALILAVRRPGCVLCRAEALELWKLKSELDSLNVNLVCFVHEWIEQEIASFSPAFWPGPVYHDTQKEFYRGFGNGKLRKANILSLLNPLGAVWGRLRKAQGVVKESNMIGDGFTLGGIWLMKPGDGGIAAAWLEKDAGQFPLNAEVLNQVKRLACTSKEWSAQAATPAPAPTTTAA